MDIVLNEEEVKFALAVDVFTRTGMRVETKDINLLVLVEDAERAQKLESVVLQITKK